MSPKYYLIVRIGRLPKCNVYQI